MKVIPFYKCIEDVNSFLYENQFNKDYENLFIDNWFQDESANRGNWSEISFCFYDEDILVGWIKISVSRPIESLNIDSFYVINKNFTVSIFRKITELLKVRINKRVPKFSFSTMVDSKAESIWRKITKKYNGIVVGTKINHVLDQSGNFRDMIMFEIHNPNFKKGLS